MHVLKTWGFNGCVIVLFSALQDATEALRINEDWPKGHFRKGKALVGLKVCVCIV